MHVKGFQHKSTRLPVLFRAVLDCTQTGKWFLLEVIMSHFYVIHTAGTS